MIKVLHVTPGLESGGAEMLVMKLVGRMDRSKFENLVVSITDEGPILGKKIRDQDITLLTLNFRRGSPNPRMVLKLAETIRRERPHVIQTWMYHANVVGSLANSIAGSRPLVWNIQNAKLDPANTKRQTLKVIHFNARLSRLVSKIICGSAAGYEVHKELGYPTRKMVIVDNGIDTDEFVPDESVREKVRRELSISPETPVVGMVARFSRQKDHGNFFRAAGILHKRRPDVRFVLCGMDVTRDNPTVWSFVTQAGVEDCTDLLGIYPDTTAHLTTAFDVATSSSSFGESFCIALGEAMACGVPCVTTAMEGPAALVGDVGLVVPISDPEALAAAWEKMLNLTPEERSNRGKASRRRVIDHFSLDAMVRNYEEIYTSLARKSLSAQPA